MTDSLAYYWNFTTETPGTSLSIDNEHLALVGDVSAKLKEYLPWGDANSNEYSEEGLYLKNFHYLLMEDIDIEHTGAFEFVYQHEFGSDHAVMSRHVIKLGDFNMWVKTGEVENHVSFLFSGSDGWHHQRIDVSGETDFHHILFTWDNSGATTIFELYINGELWTPSLPDFDVFGQINLMVIHLTEHVTFSGIIKYIKIYNSYKTDPHVTTLYTNYTESGVNENMKIICMSCKKGYCGVNVNKGRMKVWLCF